MRFSWIRKFVRSASPDQLREIAWQLYVRHEVVGSSFRCGHCRVMQEEQSEGFPIGDSLCVGDSLTVIRQNSRLGTNSLSIWCATCFSKLWKAGGEMPLPVRPPFVPDSPDVLAQKRREAEEARKYQDEFSAQLNAANDELLWAARTRVLSEEEMSRLKCDGYHIFLRFSGCSSGPYDENELEKRLNDLMLHQLSLRLTQEKLLSSVSTAVTE